MSASSLHDEALKCQRMMPDSGLKSALIDFTPTWNGVLLLCSSTEYDRELLYVQPDLMHVHPLLLTVRVAPSMYFITGRVFERCCGIAFTVAKYALKG